MLHIVNGDSFANVLGETGLPGEILVYREVLNIGPIQWTGSTYDLAMARATWMARAGLGSYENIKFDMLGFEARLSEAAQDDEVIMWFEHDLYDQLMLIRLLHFFSSPENRPEKLSLICIGHHPDISNFRGLGQLNKEQTLDLYEERNPVTDDQLDLGRRAWEAFTNPDPSDWVKLMNEDTHCLPYLDEAVLRHLQEFPGIEDGLSMSQRFLMEEVGEHPGLTVHELFMRSSSRERYVFWGDTAWATVLIDLARLPHPPLTISGPETQWRPNDPEFWKMRVDLTNLGRDILKGEYGVHRLNGVDTWRGGVYLAGYKISWAWDEVNQQLVSGMTTYE